MREIRLALPALHPAQREISAAAKRFNVLQCGRRFGKTTLGVDQLIRPALDGQPVGWFAPTYKYLLEVWREAELTLAPLSPRVNQQERRIELPTRGVIEFWTLDKPDAGRSRKYKRIVVDEASLVRDLQRSWQESIRPTLADFKGDAWFFGTPKGRNFFHALYTKGQGEDPEWASWRKPTTANPHIDPAEVEAARKDLPPAVFNQEYLGIPADDGGNPFGISAIAACVIPELSDAEPAAWGIDLAKSVDWTVACALDSEGRVCRLERWQSDWDQTRRRILDLVGEVPTLVDSTGVGDPIVEDLCRFAKGPMEGFKFTATSKQQLMEGLAAGIQRQEVRFPDGWLRHELDAFEYEYRPGGVRYSAPSGMHDDGVCALALARRKLTEQGVTVKVIEYGGGKHRRSDVFNDRLWTRV